MYKFYIKIFKKHLHIVIFLSIVCFHYPKRLHEFVNSKKFTILKSLANNTASNTHIKVLFTQSIMKQLRNRYF